MIGKMTDFAKLSILLKPVPAGLQQVLINYQVGERWCSADYSYLCKGLI
ncbi:hypothetical protein SPBRAN_1920 [uncultured Candidatus Thioglobus sp.]|nr:hypothetical protein SPBRAN_1920 [uncultured Candidatus Thioglobus sp.]